MLIQLALIVFALFGILAAIVDMGYVRLTQVQMQVAADSAAMEGLRARDSKPDGVGGIDGFASDCARRVAARDFVQWTFDDDFDLSGDARAFGAGPNIKFTDGVDNLSAYQFMSVPAQDDPDPAFRGGRTYKPYLQLNQSANAAYGDMVSGSFNPDAGAIDPGGQPLPGFYEYGTDALPDHQEYDRTDFAAGAPVPDPMMTGDCESVTPSVSTPITDASFLVRLRRTNVQNDPDLDNTEGVSSRGTGLPLLFGRGTLIQDNPDPDGYQPRRDGITVRATAIADAKPAVRIGADDPGAGRLQITNECFQALRMSVGPQSATIDAMTGAITITPCPASAANGLIDPATPIALGQLSAMVSPVRPACPNSALTNTRFVYATVVQASMEVVIGFTGIAISWVDCANNPSTATVALIRTDRPYIAFENASALLDASFPFGNTSLIAAAHDFAYDASGNPQGGAMFAPMLVR